MHDSGVIQGAISLLAPFTLERVISRLQEFFIQSSNIFALCVIQRARDRYNRAGPCEQAQKNNYRKLRRDVINEWVNALT